MKRRCSACGKCWHVERYRVHDALWPKGHTRLHMRCLEKIMGRDLTPVDLSDHKKNTEWRPLLGEFVFVRELNKMHSTYDHGLYVRNDGEKSFVMTADGRVCVVWGLMQRFRSPSKPRKAHTDRRESIMNAVLPPFFGTQDLEAAACFAWSAIHDSDFDADGNLRPEAIDRQRHTWIGSKHVMSFLNNPLMLMEESLGLEKSGSSGHGTSAGSSGDAPTEVGT